MTLIDIAIFMILIGLVVAPMIQSYNLDQKEKVKGETLSHFATINKAIADFYYVNNYYPCPALPDLPPDDPNAGKQNCTDTAPGMDQNSSIRTGSIPYKTLSLPVSDSLDGWHNKIAYTATRLQTPSAMDIPIAFDPNAGAITLKEFERTAPNDTCTTNVLDASTSIHYVLVSYGRTGVGAYSPEGVQAQACIADVPGSTTPWETENCNADAVFLNTTCAGSEVRGNNFYDDLLYFQDTAPAQIWGRSETSGTEINVYTSMSLIGINNPGPEYTLDVSGDIRLQEDPDDAANTGKVKADRICDDDGVNCYKPTSIAGNEQEMDCESAGTAYGGSNNLRSNAMVGIADDAAQCGPTYRNIPAVNCSPGYMKGITPAGVIICAITP